MIEGALVFVVFALLITAIVELGVAAFAGNAVTFAAHAAARYASLRGSASGHPASDADIQACATRYTSPLNPENLSVTITWSPDHSPGSSVEVAVTYTFRPSVPLLSTRALPLRSVARQQIVQ